MTSKRDVERHLDRLGSDDLAECPDLSLPVEEKEALNEAFDVEPETMKRP